VIGKVATEDDEEQEDDEERADSGRIVQMVEVEV
jgi:hypothetical protein